jgi:hypothetical protein
MLLYSPREGFTNSKNNKSELEIKIREVPGRRIPCQVPGTLLNLLRWQFFFGDKKIKQSHQHTFQNIRLTVSWIFLTY